MSEIAELTPWSRMALFLPRDKYGRLKRYDPDLPDHVAVNEDGMRVIKGKRTPFSEMFKQVNKRRGLSDEQIRVAWDRFKEDNPKMGKGGPRSRERIKRK